jgi:hypothetical protein
MYFLVYFTTLPCYCNYCQIANLSARKFYSPKACVFFYIGNTLSICGYIHTLPFLLLEQLRYDYWSPALCCYIWLNVRVGPGKHPIKRPLGLGCHLTDFSRFRQVIYLLALAFLSFQHFFHSSFRAECFSCSYNSSLFGVACVNSLGS